MPTTGIQVFSRTGVTYKNNVTISSNNGKGTSARLSLTDTRNSWILPNTGYENQTVSFSFQTKMNKWIKFNAKANYLHKASDNTPPQGYNKSNPLYFLMWSMNNVSMKGIQGRILLGSLYEGELRVQPRRRRRHGEPSGQL